LYYLLKSRRQIFKVILLVGCLVSGAIPETALLRSPRVLTLRSTATLPGSELQPLSWGGGCSPEGTEDHAATVFLRFPVLEKAPNCSPKSGALFSEGVERFYRRDWTVLALLPQQGSLEEIC